MSHAIALPRRRRRKPPGPAFWRAVASVAIDLAAIALAVYLIDGTPLQTSLSALNGAVWSFCLIRIDWPRLKREIDRLDGDGR